VSPSLPAEFLPAALVRHIVRGAAEDDPVRLHGAIVASLEIHGEESSQTRIFGPALDAAGGRGPECRRAVTRAIAAHLAGRVRQAA
jgi:hypothetical protein